MPSPLEDSPLEVMVFRIVSPCGRVYDLPVEKVQEDYIQYLVAEDHITREQAARNVTRENVHSWFMEQFNWNDVENYATLVKEASPQKIKEALDHLRRSSDVASVSELMISPMLVANSSAQKMDQSTPPLPKKTSRRRI